MIRQSKLHDNLMYFGAEPAFARLLINKTINMHAMVQIVVIDRS